MSEHTILTFRARGASEGRKIIMSKSVDLISRQAVIDKINERQRKLIYCFGFENDVVKIMDIAKSIVMAIPSARPEPYTERRKN